MGSVSSFLDSCPLNPPLTKLMADDSLEAVFLGAPNPICSSPLSSLSLSAQMPGEVNKWMNEQVNERVNEWVSKYTQTSQLINFENAGMQVSDYTPLIIGYFN